MVLPSTSVHKEIQEARSSSQSTRGLMLGCVLMTDKENELWNHVNCGHHLLNLTCAIITKVPTSLSLLIFRQNNKEDLQAITSLYFIFPHFYIINMTSSITEMKICIINLIQQQLMFFSQSRRKLNCLKSVPCCFIEFLFVKSSTPSFV